MTEPHRLDYQAPPAPPEPLFVQLLAAFRLLLAIMFVMGLVLIVLFYAAVALGLIPVWLD